MSAPTVDDVVRVLNEALALPDASLVIFRPGALIEFKTERLRERVTLWVEDGHSSWQIGSFDDHHCHLELGAVQRVAFEAEPVSCQGGRINYTVWFLGERECGNPYRPQGLFSVTFNRPYEADGTVRADIVGAMYAFYRRVRDAAYVSATDAFLQAEPSAATVA